jgi:hypothetical protein
MLGRRGKGGPVEDWAERLARGAGPAARPTGPHGLLVREKKNKGPVGLRR